MPLNSCRSKTIIVFINTYAAYLPLSNIGTMSVCPDDLEMQDLQDMLNIPDSPRAETPSAEMSHSLFAIPDSSSSSPTLSNTDSSSSSPTPSNTDSSPVITLHIFTYANYLGTPPS